MALIIIVFHFNNNYCELAIKTILLYKNSRYTHLFVQRLGIMLTYEIHVLELHMDMNVYDRHSLTWWLNR